MKIIHMDVTKHLITGGLLVVFAFVTIHVYAAITNTEILACIQKEGIIHVIGTEFKREDCKKKDVLISWNSVGQKGDKGEVGAVGPAGPQGLKGDIGQSSWDEGRIKALETRILALESPIVITPTCSAILCENFDSYSDGQVVGQGAWFNRNLGNNYVVQNTIFHNGAKAITNNSSSLDSIITKTGQSSLANGKQSFYVRTSNRSNWGNYNKGENFQLGLFQGSWDGPSRATLAFNKDGHVQYIDASGYVNFDTYTDDSWILVEIEWRVIDATARYRINNRVWTNWIPFVGGHSFTGFNTVGFVTFNLTPGSVTIDSIQ